MNTYEDVIQNFLVQEYPGIPSTGCAQFEAVVSEILGTKQQRFGPLPSPEQQVVIRDVVRQGITKGLPIEFLVPWASSKQGDSALDVLELSALRQLECLNQRIRRHYAPGAVMNVRVEDATDKILFPSMWTKIQSYRDTLYDLVEGLKYSCIHLVSETSALDFHQFETEVSAASHVIASVLIGWKPTTELLKIGWAGVLPTEQVDYYMKAYRFFYPELDQRQIFNRLGQYFACSLIRRKLNATAAPFNPYIQISFSLPVPGVPASSTQNRLHYRTLPERWTNCHKAPWVGKGYVQISNDNTCKVKLVSFNDNSEVYPFEIKIKDAVVQAPYILV